MRYGDHLRTLAAYNHWANQRILDAAATLTEEQLGGVGAEPTGASYDSILGTLNHSLWAQEMWLQRWQGRANPEAFDFGRDDLWRQMADSDSRLQEFAAALTDDDFERVVAYKDTGGNPHSRTLGPLFTHVINHGTYHRGEAALMLTRLDRSPGDLDYVYFIPEGV